MTRTDRARAKSLKTVQAARVTPATPGTNPALRKQTVFRPSGAGIRRHKCKMTGAQRNSEGRRSEWSMSPEYFTDPKWGKTARECE